MGVLKVFEGFLEPPKSYKHLYDWSKIISQMLPSLIIVLMIVIPNATTAAQVGFAIGIVYSLASVTYNALTYWNIRRQALFDELDLAIPAEQRQLLSK